MEENIILKKIRPMYTRILLTKDEYADVTYCPGTQIIDPTKTQRGVKELQTVLAVGPDVRGIKEGDLVCINPAAYTVKKYKKGDMHDNLEEYSNQIVGYAFPEINIDVKPCLYLDQRDIDFVVEEYKIDK